MSLKETRGKQIRATKKQLEIKKISRILGFNDNCSSKASCAFKKD